MSEILDVALLLVLLAVLLTGYPVGIALGGVSIIFACFGWALGSFDPALFYAIPSRLFGVMSNPVLVAVPLFVFMGLVLEKSKRAEEMIQAASRLFAGLRGGLSISVMMVGTLLAASTGIVGASIVALGLIALPSLIERGISPSNAGGTVAAAGTLGQIIPPSIVLIVLGDQISNAWQEAQLRAGNFATESVSITDLFAGALVPGMLLVSFYLIYLWFTARRSEKSAHAGVSHAAGDWRSFLVPLVLIIAVLGSILSGVATPSEAASVGAIGALVMSASRLNLTLLGEVLGESVHLVAMIFLIIIGATLFSLVFRGLGGDETISALLNDLPGGTYGAVFAVMLVIFVLGFFLEFIEITYIVVPLVAPVLLVMPMADGQMMNPIWLGVIIAMNLQTSFLTPPFGISLFYLRSVAPAELNTAALYRGVVPFVLLQLLALAVVIAVPALATFLPNMLFGR